MLSYSYKKHRFKQKKPHQDKVSKIQEPVIHGGRLLQIFCFQWNTVPSVLKLPSLTESEKLNKACNQKEEPGSLFFDVSSCTLQPPQSTGADTRST